MKNDISYGILPTLESDYKNLLTVLNLLDNQSLKLQELIIIFQGEKYDCNTIKRQIDDNKFTFDIRLIHLKNKSLTMAKNIGKKYLPLSSAYCYIYEDDIDYQMDYNEKLRKILEKYSADMVSGVEYKRRSLTNILKGVFYRISHVYPLNDRRLWTSIFFDKRTIKTRYLSSGLSLLKTEIFNAHKYDENLTKYALGEDMDFSYRVTQEYKGILTNEVRCVHKSKGARKFGMEQYLKEKVQAWIYHYNKNINIYKYKYSLYMLLLFLLCEVIINAIIMIKPKFIINWIIEVKHALKCDYNSNFII